MYRDNTLIPSEAIRLAALGTLLERPMPYAALASQIRHFVERVTGPSLDLLGTSLELLCHEGLAATDGVADTRETAELRITDAGREAFRVLMTSNVRAPANDVSKLVIALKIRFLDLLDAADREEQAVLLIEMCETELARLKDLQASYGTGPLGDWLGLEIAQVTQRLDWFQALQTR